MKRYKTIKVVNFQIQDIENEGVPNEIQQVS